MQKITLMLLSVVTFSFTACSQSQTKNEAVDQKAPSEKQVVQSQSTSSETAEVKPHKYGGWYCPDNLRGFPPVDLKEWASVPVIEDRLPTKEETQTESSLMFIDKNEYPDAKVMDVQLPKLARYKSTYSQKEEWVIVIQAVVVNGDSVVGFRYLNGGNGSARYREVDWVEEAEIASLPDQKFVKVNLEINNSQDQIWQVLTGKGSKKALQKIYDPTKASGLMRTMETNINFLYPERGEIVSMYADKLYGCWYVQNNYTGYDEKFLLVEDEETGTTTLKIVCGPFKTNYKQQKSIMERWAEKVKELSEG